jgi:hypothetical protein
MEKNTKNSTLCENKRYLNLKNENENKNKIDLSSELS